MLASAEGARHALEPYDLPRLGAGVNSRTYSDMLSKRL
jgi:hypothetical protein